MEFCSEFKDSSGILNFKEWLVIPFTGKDRDAEFALVQLVGFMLVAFLVL